MDSDTLNNDTKGTEPRCSIDIKNYVPSLLDIISKENSALSFNNKTGSIKRIGYLLFTSPSENRYWSKYLKEGFKHVDVLWHDGFVWLLTQHTAAFTHTVVLPVPTFEECIAFIENYGKDKVSAILKVSNEFEHEYRYRQPVASYTCVEDAKAWFGINKFCIFTPYQLYNYCVKQLNSEVIK